MENQIIHESSPCGQASDYIREHASQYTYSQYFQNVKSGEYVNWQGNNILCQNIEDMSFENQSIELFLTQDVFEHILHPESAFCEIARILKKGGKHIFTVPFYADLKNSRCRAILQQDGTIQNLEEPIYHGNPVDSKGALVTFDWGRDFVDYIYKTSGMATSIYLQHNPYMGIGAEFLEVFISTKL